MKTSVTARTSFLDTHPQRSPPPLISLLYHQNLKASFIIDALQKAEAKQIKLNNIELHMQSFMNILGSYIQLVRLCRKRIRITPALGETNCKK